MIWYNVCIVYANNRFSLPVKDFMIILIARKVVHHYWSRFINFSQNFISNRLQESSTLFGSFSSASRIKALQTQAVRNPYFRVLRKAKNIIRSYPLIYQQTQLTWKCVFCESYLNFLQGLPKMGKIHVSDSLHTSKGNCVLCEGLCNTYLQFTFPGRG